jgi:dTDP-glucose 4,6-dehydratase
MTPTASATSNPLAADLDHIVANTPRVWEELRACRLFITGGTGFIGRWLLESLVWANDRHDLGLQAVVLSRYPGRFAEVAPGLATHPAVELVAGDMQSFVLPKGAIDYVVHAATETVGMAGTYDPIHKFDADVEGTRRVIALARERKVRRLIFTSSGAVYGPQSPDVAHVQEDYPGAPDPTDLGTAYGQAKRVAEFLCSGAAAEGGPEVVIARGFAFAGPFLPLDSNYAFGNFIRDALAGGPIVIEGDGTPLRSYLYAADLAIWLWTLLVQGRSRVYNVGSDASISIVELARMIAKIVSPDARVVVRRRAVKGAPVGRYVPSVDRARTELGLVPLVSLPEAIARTAAWHRRSAVETS